MSTMNRTVLIQRVGKPKTRRAVGVLSDGCLPEDHDLDRWGITRKDVHDWTWMRVTGKATFVIEVYPPYPDPAKVRMVTEPKDVKALAALAKRWAEIANDGEAAPTGTMLRTVVRLLTTVKHQRTFLRQARDWLATCDMFPDQGKQRDLMIKAMNTMLGVKGKRQ